jgi:hypothetical protein
MKRLAPALAEHGMIARGGFVFAKDEDAPPGPSGKPVRSIVLAGHGGGTIWPHFRAWLETRAECPDNPLDAWSKEVLDDVAGRYGARAVFPFEKPWLPFQQWAMRAEGLRPSPLGILMHPEFGPWHAYRGALLFDVEIEVPAPANPIHLCNLCDGKPCINACPAKAVSGAVFDVPLCHGLLRTEEGGTCRRDGCLARSACPHDRHRYGPEQIAFHMAAHLDGLAGD